MRRGCGLCSGLKLRSEGGILPTSTGTVVRRPLPCAVEHWTQSVQVSNSVFVGIGDVKSLATQETPKDIKTLQELMESRGLL